MDSDSGGVPSALRAARIASPERRVVGREVCCLEQTASTNDDAFAALDRDGEDAHGRAIFAESQTAGRGRRGRSWLAQPSLGLLFSVALRAPKAPPAASLVAGAAVAMRDAIRQMSGITVRIKWPNDLYVGPRKLCGILVEARAGAQRANLVVGIGINLNQTEEDFHPDVRAIAGSLRMASARSFDREAFAASALDALDDALPAALSADYLRIENEFAEGLDLLGKRVRVTGAQGESSGQLLAFDCVRGLAIQSESGLLWLPAETTTALQPSEPSADRASGLTKP
ncbi:MAG: biotin--[acetyl-CoA-carboxylase] ligase [Planctomycetes bacterium]|nr:biotin--[acetyl-CoA-carboxylase] ligase [Planctomycetota bacterium]